MYYQRRWWRTASSLARGTNTGRRGKRWEATTVALIKPSRLSLAAQERKKAKEKLLAAIYLRALTDPYSFRDRRRSVESLNACWSRSRLRFLFHETPRPCDRDGRSCFIRKAFLDEGEKGLLPKRERLPLRRSRPLSAQETPVPPFSLFYFAFQTRENGSFEKKGLRLGRSLSSRRSTPFLLVVSARNESFLVNIQRSGSLDPSKIVRHSSGDAKRCLFVACPESVLTSPRE